mmetsp:Transcript_8897/g.13351  ORF Transcript_8897/g.13351 Transcript_8897/m.13351 type:complete len:300 (-) Transcript_8897:95-994(-)
MIAATTISRMASSQAPKVLRLRLAGNNTTSQVKNNNYMKRYFSDKTKEAANTTAKESTSSTTATTAAKEEAKKTTWWNNTAWWGTAGAMAGWGMSGAAIYDALESSPELISLNMTGVLLVYSSLFARWAFVVKPQNLLLAGCHITNVGAQMNQLRRAVEYKKENGKDDEVDDIMKKAGATAAAGAACVLGGPMVQSALVNANLGFVSSIAAAEAGPFTVHFWAPMSKWMISGASFLELDRPTEKISLAQYTALTMTGFFFSRYALLVAPINYTLCSVNIALFGSSAWHLGRKIKADFLS